MPDEISEENQVGSESITKLHQKIDDLRKVIQIALFLIIFIFVIQVAQIVTGPLSPLYYWSFIIIIIAVSFLSLAICILQTERPVDSHALE